ncbi:hypothetical protein QLX67_05695, partial [Balneolaceae bacterium ANBcel3]|nr:hypothetical protein [Balneolaceae bacterium ANBcel3]
MPKTFVLAAFFFLSATIGGCGLFSDADEKFYFGEKRQPDKLEYQYIALANEIHSVKPCYLIHSKSLRVAAFNSIGSQVSLLRSTCFSKVGKYSGNEQICDHVRSASTLLFSGANFSKDSCR